MSTSAPQARPSRPGRVVELEIWTGCRELIVEGSIDPRTIDKFEDSLRRTVESDHDLVLIDLDRCDFLDVAAVKQLVVVRELLSCRRCEMLVFAPEGQARELLRRVGAFDCEPSLAAPRDPPRCHEV